MLTDPHTDYGLITLLATDGVAGLEVRPRDGEWTMVEAPARSLIVNLGDMLARWTNDRYVSTPHRVSAPASSDRYSVPFFVNPDPATTVSCLPACVTAERPCRYEPVTAAEFLAQRIADGGYMRDSTDVDVPNGVAPQRIAQRPSSGAAARPVRRRRRVDRGPGRGPARRRTPTAHA